jgi:hypothetical protein
MKFTAPEKILFACKQHQKLTPPPPPQLNRYPTQGQVSVTMPMIKCMQTRKQEGNDQSFGEKKSRKTASKRKSSAISSNK